MKKTYFISDLHLDPSRPHLFKLFDDFIEKIQSDVEALYILGDLVEYWIGDDAYDGSLDAAFDPLSRLASSGCTTWVMHGNRDFLISDSLAASLSINLLRDDQHLVTIAGKPLLLMHGDTLCTDDTDYQAMRLQLRSSHWQNDFLQLPVEERLAKAQQLRTQSLAATSQKEDVICDVNQAEIEKTLLAEKDLSRLLHGHTHRPAYHQFTMTNSNGQTLDAQRWVLGDWQAQKIIYAIADDTKGSIELVEWH